MCNDVFLVRFYILHSCDQEILFNYLVRSDHISLLWEWLQIHILNLTYKTIKCTTHIVLIVRCYKIPVDIFNKGIIWNFHSPVWVMNLPTFLIFISLYDNTDISHSIYSHFRFDEFKSIVETWKCLWKLMKILSQHTPCVELSWINYMKWIAKMITKEVASFFYAVRKCTLMS